MSHIDHSSWTSQNSLVENYFGQLKSNTLDYEKNIRCTQFLRTVRTDILSLKVESDLAIDKKTVNKTGSYRWKMFTRKKIKNNNYYFSGR